MKKKTTVDLIAKSDRTSLYSISFEKDGTTEFEKFVEAFETNGTYNSDYQRIIAALQVIMCKLFQLEVINFDYIVLGYRKK